MRKLYEIINKELRKDENIFITTKSKINNLNDNNWWKFEEYAIEQVLKTYSGEEKVEKFWHEDGLCIILNI